LTTATTPPGPKSGACAAFGRAARVFPLVTAAVFSGACGHRARMTTARVERHDLVVPVLCDGVLEPGAGGEVRASQAATVASLPVRDGARVAAGEVLLTLSNPDLSERARGSRSDAAALAAELETARSESSALSQEAARRRRTLESDERLLRAGAITREARDADAAALSDAEARLRGAEAKVTSLSGNGESSRLALAERSASDLEREAGALTVRSPAAGIVYGLPRRIGMRVEAGDVLASIADPSARRVRIRIDEPDVPRIARGERLTVTFDGLPGRRWEGRVVEVAAGLREEGGRRVGDVSGEIEDREALLPGNASVNVSIVTAERRGVLVIPRAAIFRDGARRIVYVPQSGKARRREVSVGVLGPTEAEVTAGLSDGDRVILPGVAPLSDGVPVSVSGD
jgi:HlyD family secretion protein